METGFTSYMVDKPSLFIHLSVEICFQMLAFVNIVAVNIEVQINFQDPDSFE